MSKSNVPKTSGVQCPECGAQVEGFQDCWLCQRRSIKTGRTKAPAAAAASESAGTHVYQVGKQRASEDRQALWLVTILSSVLICLVGFGVLQREFTIGVGFIALACAALLAIVVVASKRSAEDNASIGSSVLSALSTVFMGIVLSIAVILLLLIAAGIALCAICFAIMSSMH